MTRIKLEQIFRWNDLQIKFHQFMDTMTIEKLINSKLLINLKLFESSKNIEERIESASLE